MSSALSVDAMPFMIGLLRWPALNSASCLTRYSGCCPWMIGLAGLPREPSIVWQAMHTPLAMASPRARSGLPPGACAVFAAGVGAGAPLLDAAVLAPADCEGVGPAGGADAPATALAAAALAAAPDAAGCCACAATPMTRPANTGQHARATAFM